MYNEFVRQRDDVNVNVYINANIIANLAPLLPHRGVFPMMQFFGLWQNLSESLMCCSKPVYIVNFSPVLVILLE